MGNELRWAGVETSTWTFAICATDGDGEVVCEAETPADASTAMNAIEPDYPKLVTASLA